MARSDVEVPQVDLEEANCGLCGSWKVQNVYSGCRDQRHNLPGAFDLIRCLRCGLVRTSPRPTRDTIGAYYPASYTAYSSDVGDGSFTRRALKALVHLPYTVRYGRYEAGISSTPKGRILDVGCGSGKLLTECARLGWEVWGIEPDRESAESLIERLNLPPERIAMSIAEEASLPSGFFDLIIMSHVLEHVFNPRLVLAKAHDWLRPGGILRIWVPNISSLESRVFRRYWFGLDLPRHLWHYDRHTLRSLLAESEFQLERVIPQCQGFTLSGSIQLVADHLRGRKGECRRSRALYYGTMPMASVLLGMGSDAVLEVTARRRSSM
jgi:2-polyprenyl-3-methyl-5-hydroxy-6-metoxy-1,4-benzoquinol methylase